MPSLFVSLWCKKCEKRTEHLNVICLHNPSTNSKNPKNPDNVSGSALIFECQECGQNKQVFLLEFT